MGKQSHDLAGLRLVVTTPRPPIFIHEFLTESWGQGSCCYLLPNDGLSCVGIDVSGGCFFTSQHSSPKPLGVGVVG